MERKDK
jgi:hypothetical protein